MAEFLTTSLLVASIENLLRNAKQRVVLISPFLKLSRNLRERLADIDARGVKTTIVYGKEELSDVYSVVPKLEHLSVKFLDNLHAKACASESEIIVGSMNLYEYSEQHNREMGIHISLSGDELLFAKASAEIESILRVAEHVAGSLAETNRERRRRVPPDRGVCIRCGTDWIFAPGFPLCGDCYETWAGYSDRDYAERFCHACKAHADVSYARPLCSDCQRLLA